MAIDKNKDKEVKSTIVETKEEIKEVQPSESTIDTIAIMKMMQEMQSQLLSLKEENETLKAQKSIPTQNQNSNTDDFNRLVPVRNCYQGLALTLKLDEKGTITTIKGYGTVVRKRLIELLDICRLNSRFAELGHFIIDDAEIVEKYFPDMIEHYKKTISKETFAELGKMNIQQLTELYINSNYVYRDAIVRKFISEWAKGEDINYINHAKIKALTEASKSVGVEIDVMAMINAVMERENTQKEFAK